MHSAAAWRRHLHVLAQLVVLPLLSSLTSHGCHSNVGAQAMVGTLGRRFRVCALPPCSARGHKSPIGRQPVPAPCPRVLFSLCGCFSFDSTGGVCSHLKVAVSARARGVSLRTGSPSRATHQASPPLGYLTHIGKRVPDVVTQIGARRGAARPARRLFLDVKTIHAGTHSTSALLLTACARGAEWCCTQSRAQ